MKPLQLRHHNPLAAGGRREPANGAESPMRASIGFVPRWFAQRCGVDFSRRWHHDPVYRRQSLKLMKKELVQSFPLATDWDLGDQSDLNTLSGVYGVHLIAHVFGLKLRYARDQWPALEPESRLTVEEIEALDSEKLLSGPVVQELFTQMDEMQSRFGPIHGYLNWQGVLNNAMQIRGPEVFRDFYQRPGFLRGFFELIYQVMLGLIKLVQQKQRASGFAINHFSTANCTLNMLGPQLYDEFLLHYDQSFAAEFERFGMHTCNWDITPYLDSFARLPNLGYLDMGMETDFARVKAEFPHARRAVMYWPPQAGECAGWRDPGRSHWGGPGIGSLRCGHGGYPGDHAGRAG
jgi:hypothetical protein